MKKWIAVLLVGLLVGVLTACGGGGSKQAASGGEGEKIVIKFSHVTSPESTKGKAAQKFADLAAEKTGGKVKVEVYPSSQLYGDKEELDALVSGNVHMIAPSVTKMVKLDPRFQFTDMPFLFRDRDHVLNFFKSDIAKQLLESERLQSNDIKGLAFWENGFKEFTNNKKPLKTPKDLTGLKFRVQAGKVLEGQFKALGAGSATIPFGETYAALQQGTVDGTENTFNNIDTQKYEEVQKYLTVSNHGRIDYAIFVNNSFWQEMPEDVRTKVEEALKEATEYEWKIAGEEDQNSFKKLKSSGKMQVNELSDAERAEFEKTLEPVYKKFESVITKEIIDGIKNLK
ncbi:TRAP transporter substrate-binding protein [Aneurinibacillus sp. REN35]|uniref:TRAP transporter substrate-binding protein n=1 Tax=Aneurinibacillus sp. REN35 TaxID=3237286 RepID=UPI00352774A3